MKIFNAPDLHIVDKRIKPEWHAKGIASLAMLAETIEREKPDLLDIPGDLWHGGVQNSEAAGFPTILRLFGRILDICPVAAVGGTGSHDPVGAYKALTLLKAKYPFIFLDPAEYSPPVAWICDDGKVAVELWSDSDPVGDGHKPKLMIIGLPEPTREWLLATMGGEDATAALKEELRRILLGFGALRAQYPDAPCVFLYHGAFAGATMQNGQTVGAAEIVIGREDLQLIAPDITARYGGNGYPKEWGELGQVGFDIVDLQAGDTYASLGHVHLAQEVVHGRDIAITRVPYPHPRRVKFSLPWPEPAGDVEGVQAWICYKATKEEAAKIDTAAVLEAYKEQGALEGSRVTVDTIYTETVRAAEITEKRTLREKMLVKAEADGDPAPVESVLLKADQLEKEAEILGYGGASHHLRTTKVRTRGHKAHVRRLGVEEITLDLAKYGPGLISLVAPNGSGKTAFGENSHWFPCEWSPGRNRKGGLKDNFCLRDSAREVWKDDPRTGEQYRALMEIDGANESGKTECHLFYKPPGAENWAPLAGGKGKQADYLEGVQKLEGTATMFMRSAFWPQEPSDKYPRIRRATEGQKKELFAELAISVPYKVYAKSAKDQADHTEAEISIERGRIAEVEQQLAALPGLCEERRAGGLRALSMESDRKGLEENGLKLKAEADALALKVQEQRSLSERINGLNEQVTAKQKIINDAQASIADYQEALTWKPEAEKVIAEWDKLKEQENAETRRLSAINADNARLQGEYTTRLTAHSENVRKLEADRAALKTKSATLAGARNVLQAQIDHLEAQLGAPLNENCPTCGQLLPEPKRSELETKRAESETKLAELKRNHENSGREIAKFDAQLAAITLPLALPPFVLAPVNQAPLRSILAAIATLKIDQARKNVTTAQEAATRIEEAEKQKDQAEGELGVLHDTLASLESRLDATIERAHAEVVKRLEAAREEYQGVLSAIAGLRAEIQGLEKRIAELQVSEKDLGDRKVTLEERATCAAEWRYLEAVCGPDGIPALELDALGPGIAAEANKLLLVLKDYDVENHYDQIKFDTTRIAGKGSKTHQIEDFTIYCHDTQHDDWVDFALISVGEAVWVDTALMEAFAVIRERNSGKRSLTQWRDESDAALDPEARQAYVAILQAGHDASGRWQTIITTHSPEAQEMIAQKIDLMRLAKESRLEAAT
jgi:DNA repair exonuclease SbcCD ATPase subunit